MILAGASATGFLVQDLLVTTMLFVRDLAFMSGREVRVGREYQPNGVTAYDLRQPETTEFVREGERALEALRSRLDSADVWPLEAEYPRDGIVLRSQFQPRLGVYFIYTEAVLNYNFEWAFRKSWGVPGKNLEWYKDFSRNEIVQWISEKCRIVHETTEPMLGGWIAARDFVSVTCHEKIGEKIYWPFCNVTWPGLPPKDGIVRSVAHIGSGYAFSPHKTDKTKSVFQSINGMDFQVPFVPTSILKTFAAARHRQFVLALRRHLDEMAASS
ncbi:unnamed protein product [Darwinula stevensoni]|uniref:START domain-containing protein n=1 Tax=Darwinula stevensoni TaxID=69355 RepID=A0A7R9AD17_9CRUS|nr:unnamed protein product [Darwinula stevensoni]CAG0900693.1 unnamed protein product [Darwinula stevensoni]